MTWLWVVVAVVLTLVVLAGVGRSRETRTLSAAEAQEALASLVQRRRSGLPTLTVAHTGSPGEGGEGNAVDPGPAAAGMGDRNEEERAAFWDGAVPAAVAAGAGLTDWLSADTSALEALGHVTGENIANAWDFHRVVSENEYQLASAGSLANWRGHVGEQQIREQVEAWAGGDAVSMPESANFEGADLSLFGADFQVKFYADFNDIDNKHGDTLIVNEDAENIPDDALVVDLSQPFDVSLLEGHDVIVAEGLTIAGATEAWESAAGDFAGGLDLGDVVDGAGDALLPGIGAAVRVVASGYQRREALGDPALRSLATGRVARDAAEGTALVGTAAFVGWLCGLGVDVASMGLTAGAGQWIGTVIGSWFGGRVAGGNARARDAAAIARATEEVTAAVEEYGEKVEDVESLTSRQWSAVTASAESRRAEHLARAQAQARVISQRATADLEGAMLLSLTEQARMVSEAGAAVRGARTWSLAGWRRRRDWQARAARWEATEDSTVSALELAVAAPDGAAVVDAWLDRVVERRSTIVAAASAAMTFIQQSALASRAAVASDMNTERSRIREKGMASLEPAVERVQMATEDLKKELTLAGRPHAD